MCLEDLEGKSVAIHTPTQIAFDQVVEKLKKLGLTYLVGSDGEYSNYWPIHRETTRIGVFPFSQLRGKGSLAYGSIKHKGVKYTVNLTNTEFLKTANKRIKLSEVYSYA